MESLNPKKLNEVQGKVQYWAVISNRFTALENLGDGVDINRAWKLLKRIYKF
jgi:hypothetical protein